MNISKARSFPGADIGGDHELEMTTFRLRLQRVKNWGNTIMSFSLEKSQGPQYSRKFSSNDRRKVCSIPGPTALTLP